MSARVFPAAVQPGGNAVRAVRSTVVGVVCTVTAAVGHASAGGVMPVQTTAVAFCGAVAVAWLLSVRRVRPGQMVGLLLLCQACVHLGGGTADMTMSSTMIGAHAAATLISAVLLARGEAFVWQVAERLGLRAVPHGLRAAAVPVRPAATPVVVARSLHDVRLAHSRAERGPPVGS